MASHSLLPLLAVFPPRLSYPEFQIVPVKSCKVIFVFLLLYHPDIPLLNPFLPDTFQYSLKSHKLLCDTFPNTSGRESSSLLCVYLDFCA